MGRRGGSGHHERPLLPVTENFAECDCFARRIQRSIAWRNSAAVLAFAVRKQQMAVATMPRAHVQAEPPAIKWVRASERARVTMGTGCQPILRDSHYAPRPVANE